MGTFLLMPPHASAEITGPKAMTTLQHNSFIGTTTNVLSQSCYSNITYMYLMPHNCK